MIWVCYLFSIPLSPLFYAVKINVKKTLWLIYQLYNLCYKRVYVWQKYKKIELKMRRKFHGVFVQDALPSLLLSIIVFSTNFYFKKNFEVSLTLVARTNPVSVLPNKNNSIVDNSRSKYVLELQTLESANCCSVSFSCLLKTSTILRAVYILFFSDLVHFLVKCCL